jgi:hypothetical protein
MPEIPVFERVESRIETANSAGDIGSNRDSAGRSVGRVAVKSGDKDRRFAFKQGWDYR